MPDSKSSFVINNLVKGLLWMGFFVLLFIVAKKIGNRIDFLKWLEPLFNHTILIILIFLTSEVIIGIIPPEVFIIWALRHNNYKEFIGYVILFAFISYGAGICGYYIGHYLGRSLFYRYLKRKFLKNLDERLKVFGMYLIMIAALTPVPFSGVSMLVGSVRYPFRKYLLVSLTRFIKFAILAVVFWQTNISI